MNSRHVRARIALAFSSRRGIRSTRSSTRIPLRIRNSSIEPRDTRLSILGSCSVAVAAAEDLAGTAFAGPAAGSPAEARIEAVHSLAGAGHSSAGDTAGDPGCCSSLGPTLRLELSGCSEGVYSWD